MICSVHDCGAMYRGKAPLCPYHRTMHQDKLKKERNDRYRKAHGEQLRAYHRKWDKDNAEKRRAQQKARYKIKKGGVVREYKKRKDETINS